jgi:hypothetical protein
MSRLTGLHQNMSTTGRHGDRCAARASATTGTYATRYMYKTSEAPRTKVLQGPEGHVDGPCLGELLAFHRLVGHRHEGSDLGRRAPHAVDQCRRGEEEDHSLFDLSQLPVSVVCAGAAIQHVLGHAGDGAEGERFGALAGQLVQQACRRALQ